MAHPRRDHESPEERRTSRLKHLIDEKTRWATGLAPVRALHHFSDSHSPLMASGLAGQGVFSLFAAIWVLFSVIGMVSVLDGSLREQLITLLGHAVPGLITTSTSRGAIDPDVLLSAHVLSWTGAIALVSLLFTALGWLGSVRSAIAAVLELPPSHTNFVLAKLKDLGIGVALAVVLVVSAALIGTGSVLTGSALHSITGLPDSAVLVAGRVVAFFVVWGLCLAVVWALFRFVAGVRLPWKRMRGALICTALAWSALAFFGGSIVRVSKNNPLLASFAVILGLVLFFTLACEILLFAASWIAVQSPNESGDTSDDADTSTDSDTDDVRPQTRAERFRARLRRLFTPPSRSR